MILNNKLLSIVIHNTTLLFLYNGENNWFVICMSGNGIYYNKFKVMKRKYTKKAEKDANE